MNKLVALLVLILSPIVLAEVQMTPQQQETANKLTAKGGLVIPLAADADSVVVSLNMAGKQATDADLAELKNLPKISQLNLANTAVTDAASAKPLTPTCPFPGHPVLLPKTRAFEGNTIGFGCDKCPVEFQKDPKKFAPKIKAPAAPAAKNPDEKNPDAKPADKKP